METQGSFADAIEWFLDGLRLERDASAHTLSAYLGDLEKAADFFRARGRRAFSEIRGEDLLAFRASLRPPMAPATVRRRASSLRSLLKFLKRRGGGPNCDLPETGGMRTPKRLPKALSLEEITRLLQAPNSQTPPGLRDRALMELVYGAGLRVSEAVGLRTDEIDLEERSIRVRGKRGKVRILPLPDQVAGQIAIYWDRARPKLLRRPIAELLVADRGKAMTRQVAFDRLRRYAQQAGISKTVSPHTLRHTYAVHLLQGGADLRVVQDLLGHSSIATTEIYTQLNLDEVRKRYLLAHPRG